MKIKKAISGNLDWVLLMALLFLMNYRIWSPTFWPQHDTFRFFQTFYIFYNGLLLKNEFARWLPYGTYGIQADFFQINGLSVTDYLIGVLGWIFRIKNVLNLFWISILMQQFLLLFGTYSLSRELFSKTASIFFITFGVLASTIWANKMFFNFHMFYLLPFVFYFLLASFQQRKPHFFWLAGVAFVVMELGVPIFMVTLHALICLIFLCFILFQHGFPKNSFSKNWANLLSAALFGIAAVSYLYFQWHMFDFAHCDRPFRDPATNQVPLDVFLTYQGQIDLRKFMMLFFSGQTDTFTLYVGLLPLIFVVYSIWNVRSNKLIIFEAIAAFLILFSVSDISFVARTAYHLFPPLHYFRYIGHIGCMIRLFLFLIAGFGLEHFLNQISNPETREADAASKALLVSGASVLGLMIFLAALNVRWKFFEIAWPEFSIFSGILGGIFILIFTGGRSRSLRWKGGLAIFFLAIDLLSFQNLFFKSLPEIVSIDKRVSNVSLYQFQPTRSWTIPDGLGRAKAAFSLIDQSSDRETSLMYPFAQFDPCVPADWTPYWASGSYSFLANRMSLLLQNTPALQDFRQTAASDPKVRFALTAAGCEASKLYLVSNVLFAHGSDEAEELIRDIAEVHKKIVLERASESLESSYTSGAEEENAMGSIEMTDFSFNHLSAKVNVTRESGVFLYYADSYHPGWQAYLDREKTPILKANLAFKAVYIPKGVHVVRFTYFDGFKGIAGLGIAFVSILFVVYIIVSFIQMLISRSRVAIS